MPRVRLPLVLLAIAILGVAVPCSAAPTDDASEILRKGKAALIEEDAARARRLFRIGLDLETTPTERWRMLLGLALSSELEGGLAEAATTYRTFLKDSNEHPDAATATWQRRRRRAKADVRRLESKLLKTHARLDLRSEPPGAAIWIDGVPTPHATPATVYVAAGVHELRYELDGHDAARFPLDVEPGVRPVVYRTLRRVEPAERPADAPATPAPTTAPSPDRAPATPPAATADVLLAGALTTTVGAALLLAGGTIHRSALRDADEVRMLEPVPENVARDDALRTRIGDYQVAYVTSYVVGGLAVGAGLTLMLVELLASEDESSNATRLRPHGLGVAGRF